MDKTAIFGCRGIGISFGNRAILSDVSLSVFPGEVLGLVGPNGAGKTFFVRNPLCPPTSIEIKKKLLAFRAIPAKRPAKREVAGCD